MEYSTIPVPRPVGEWNEGELIVRGSAIEYRVNGRIIRTVDLADDDFQERAGVLAKKWLDRRNRGFQLSLIPRGRSVAYRDIAIKDLTNEKP